MVGFLQLRAACGCGGGSVWVLGYLSQKFMPNTYMNGSGDTLSSYVSTVFRASRCCEVMIMLNDTLVPGPNIEAKIRMALARSRRSRS